MTVYKLNPLSDPRWLEFLSGHPAASIFHTPGWLRALQSTHGYEPVVFTTAPPGAALRNGLVFCQVNSWLTGRRLVGLPFSDHCQPLGDGCDVRAILESLRGDAGRERWKYIELRPASHPEKFEEDSQFSESCTFTLHRIDLRPDLQTIYRGFHDSCVRRKIKRADRENLTYECGSSELLLKKFWHLLLLTRRRHQLPPQPIEWFRNLMRTLCDKLIIHVMSKGSTPVASILTLGYKNSLMYKYGCSDAKFHNLGGMSLLFWKAIQNGKQAGAEELDLGRSAAQDPGLLAFKEHLGGAASRLNYYRYPGVSTKQRTPESRMAFARRAFAELPTPLLTGAGRLLYRHLG